MTYLQLCKRLHLLLRIGEEAPGTQPTTVASQEGVLAEIVAWIAAANDDILRNSEFWRFMTAPHTFTVPLDAIMVTRTALVTAVADYQQLEPFTNDEYAFLLSRPDVDPEAAEQEVVYVPWQDFHGHLDIAPLSSGQPRYFTVNPNGDVEFDTRADRAYVMRSAYRKAPVPMTTDNQQSQVPERFHQTIVWWAVVNYYCVTRDATKEFADKSAAQMRRELTALRNSELPTFLSGA